MRCEKVYPKNWLPQKIGYPQKIGCPKKLIKKKLATPEKLLPQKIDQNKIGHPKILAYFIARGFIIEFWKNGVLYFVWVYECDSNIMSIQTYIPYCKSIYVKSYKSYIVSRTYQHCANFTVRSVRLKVIAS